MADNKPSSDLDIARSVPLKEIREIAEKYGIHESELTPHGRHMAKVPPSTDSKINQMESTSMLPPSILPLWVKEKR